MARVTSGRVSVAVGKVATGKQQQDTNRAGRSFGNTKHAHNVRTDNQSGLAHATFSSARQLAPYGIAIISTLHERHKARS